jgi:hypothetical protein
MQKLKLLTKSLLKSQKAATAVIFAISVPVIVGGSALAIDLASFRMVQSRMQSAVDAAALSSVMQIAQNGPVASTAVAMVDGNVPSSFGHPTSGADVTVGTYSKANGFVPGIAANNNAVRVYAERSPARGNGVGRIFSMLWGNSQITVATTAIAARPANAFYEPPEGAILDNEAGDYNEMYAYCYDMTGAGTPASRRSQMTLIANNLPAGQNIVTISGGVITANPPQTMPWPTCNAKDQSLSFRLRNIRHVKSNPQLWANPNATVEGRQPGRPELNHYTDTMVSNGVEAFDSNTSKILETVLCDTSDKCDPSKAGTIVPKGKQRATPSRASNPCQPGKFMYFGFEDRPGPSYGGSWLDATWTDFDYDDIAIRMKCPNSGKLNDPWPRLVG